MSKKILRIAAPIALSFLAPGIGTALGITSTAGTTALGAGLGAAGGAIGGGGLKGAALGALTGGVGNYLGATGKLGSAFGGSASGMVNPNVAGQALTKGVAGGVSGVVNPNVTSGLFGAGKSSFGGLADAASKIYGGYSGTQASDKAAKQQLEAQRKGIAALNPYALSGQMANQRTNELLGLDPNADQATIQNALRNSPGYQFRLSEGTQALDRSAAARGGLLSGAAQKELTNFGQGLADQTYNDYLSNLRPQTSQGLSAASGQAGIYDQIGNVGAANTVSKNNIQAQTLSSLFGGSGDQFTLDENGNVVRKKPVGSL
jgi:hypothetical protein